MVKDAMASDISFSFRIISTCSIAPSLKATFTVRLSGSLARQAWQIIMSTVCLRQHEWPQGNEVGRFVESS